MADIDRSTQETRSSSSAPNVEVRQRAFPPSVASRADVGSGPSADQQHQNEVASPAARSLQMV
jgi:hypothetical protein